MVKDEKFTKCRAVIDEDLMVKNGDKNFFAFIGENAIYSLARSIYPADVQRIEDAIKNTVNVQINSDRIGQHLADKLNRLDEVTKNLSEKLGRVPELDELAKAMNISKDEASILLKTSLDTLSVNEDTQITDGSEANGAYDGISTEEAFARPEKDPLEWRVNKK